MLLRDLQSVVLYDQEGKFAGIRRPNSKLPIEIDGLKIEVVDAIGSSGLNLKVKDMTTSYQKTTTLIILLFCFGMSFCLFS